MPNAARRRLRKSTPQEAKRISFHLTFGTTHETTEEMFERVYAINVKAPYFLVAELAPLMAKRGKGAIVNLSTMVADYGASGMSLYGSSKAAINLLTKVWT